MDTSINAIGFVLSEDQQELINKKIERIKYADDLIVNCAIKIRHEKEFTAEANVNFRWGATAHVQAEDFEFAASVNKMMDMLDMKVKKEKDKIQDK